MPKCPECGHSEESSAEWVDFYMNTDYGGAGLVVCPSCDSVLGGMAAEGY